MDKVFTISRPEGDLHFTLDTLYAIQLKLLEALKQKQPPEKYARLVREVEVGNAVLRIYKNYKFEDCASIGSWKLEYSFDKKLYLNRVRAHPSKPVRQIHTASLEWLNDEWQVVSVGSRMVRTAPLGSPPLI